MKNAPNINVVILFDVEDQMWILLQRPETQTRKVQFMGVPGEAGALMTADMAVCPLQRINELSAASGAFSLG